MLSALPPTGPFFGSKVTLPPFGINVNIKEEDKYTEIFAFFPILMSKVAKAEMQQKKIVKTEKNGTIEKISRVRLYR